MVANTATQVSIPATLTRKETQVTQKLTPNAARLVKTAERDSASAIDELREVRRSEDADTRKKLVQSATARLESALAALKQAATDGV